MQIAYFRIVLVAVAAALVASPANAYRPDAPFAAALERNAEAWENEDRSIDERLAALEKKFGKRPNLIYIR